MNRRIALIATALLLSALVACDGSAAPSPTPPPPSPVPTLPPTPASEPTATLKPTDIATSSPTPIPPTKTPEGYIPQIYIGITEEALRLDGCGDGVIFWTMNYSGNYEDDTLAMSYWDWYPDIPKPQDGNGNVYKYNTRAFRGNLDVCAKPNFPIVFQMDKGIVRENRTRDYQKNLAVMTIEILEGPGEGWETIWAHYNPDIDLETPGMQHIQSGTIVERGDVIATTNDPMEIPETVLNFGIFNSMAKETANFGYWWNQELAYIGLDGQVNLIRP